MEQIVNSKMSAFTKMLEQSNQQILSAEHKLSTACQNLESSTTQKLADQMGTLQGKIQAQSEQLAQQGADLKRECEERQSATEKQCEDTVARCNRSSEIADELKMLFEKDYKEFIRDRKRWKSDFDQAQNRAVNNFAQIEGLLTSCTSQNETNTKLLKMVIDAQMIAQLLERQDLEDKKQIGLFGKQTATQIVHQRPPPPQASEDPVKAGLSPNQAQQIKRPLSASKEQETLLSTTGPFESHLPKGVNVQSDMQTDYEVSELFKSHINQE